MDSSWESTHEGHVDPFDSLLGLEDQYYAEGYKLGIADGSHGGRIEGRIFGLEKGLEKYAAMGVLAGRAAVWIARLPKDADAENNRSSGKNSGLTVPESPPGLLTARGDLVRRSLDGGKGQLPERSRDSWGQPLIPSLPLNVRLDKHIQTLSALTEAASLSKQNNEESVSDFDDRLKRADGKVKVIEKTLGEPGMIDVEDRDSRTASRKMDKWSVKVKGDGTRGKNNIEDFGVPSQMRQT
ncbi:hypothetical protein LTR66_003995 [Elasticomyces elasticus]|nr:hypothetical protein LTR28_005799 [Elasticomyces elasticus]KAK4983682.1 hypothetical protein LTR50_007077 [Elasticomyces elasticus]KAK4996385.1 hypothetical protein LTR66_003995 [Elasticomyces elasticus]